MQWKENELGILLPVTPFSYGSQPPGLSRLRKVLGSKYLLKKPRRQVRAGDRKVPKDLTPWDLGNLDLHVTGRKDESVRVLLGAALLRKFGLVNREAIVGYKGAAFQRGKGSPDYPAAHRFPCNPTIANWDLPHYAPSGRLKNALKLPLEKTDYLPKLVNRADQLFEASGACDAVARTIQFVLHEQATDKDVNLKLIRHAAVFELFPGYTEALQDALAIASSNAAIEAIDPAVLQHVNETWFSSSDEEGQAANSVEVVQFALVRALQVGDALAEPMMLAPPAMAQYIGELEALLKER